MIILHAAWFEKQLFVWGESPLEDESKLPSGRGRIPEIPEAKPYPYDAGAERLAEGLTSLGFSAEKRNPEKVSAWLPGLGRHPFPSSPMLAERPASKARPTLLPWTVTAYSLDMEEASDLLCSVMGKKVPGPGIISGNDLLWWAEALKFAGSLVAEQAYLPGIRLEAGEFRGRWEPVYFGPHTPELVGHAKAMPPAARALTPETAHLPPETPGTEVLKEFLSGALDYLVRFTVSGKAGPEKKKRGKKPSFDSVHDAWVSALRGEGASDSLIHGKSNEILQLAGRLKEWQRPIVVMTTSPFRLCFRLEEPEGPERENGLEETAEINGEKETAELNGKEETAEEYEGIEIPKNLWNVRYLLQAHDDPSLLIPLKDAWKPGKKSPLQKYDVKNLRQFLLFSLGQAASLIPWVESSLERPDPEGHSLDTKKAYEFLTEKAISLDRAGFGVMLPAWWTGKGTKARLQSRAKVESKPMQIGSGLNLQKVINFNWEMALGDKKLTVEELEVLAELKSPLVKVRGQWVEVNGEEIRAAIEFWKKNPTGEASALDIVKMAIGAEGSEKTNGPDFESVEASGWVKELLGRLKEKAGFEELPAPAAFSGTLRPYQVRGYSWLAFLRQWGLGACLADDMGLGKTIQTLAQIQHDREEGPNQKTKKPVLLVCPTSVINNWKKEAARFTPDLSVMVHHGVSRKKETEFKAKAKKHALVVSSYGLLQRDLAFLKGVKWAGIVLDEAQNIKNSGTKQAVAARSLKAEYRIALTGTPVENNVGDLWSIMEFLNPGFLGSQAGFKRNFFIPIQAEHDRDAALRLKDITGPFILRRLKTDRSIITDLPEKMEMKTYCTLTKEQVSLYAAVLKDIEEAMEDSEGIQRRGLILSALARLKQVCNHPAQFLKDNSSIPDRSGKLARLTEMLEVIIENGEKTLVFTQFAEMGKILKEHLQNTFGCEVLFLHGAVSRKQRDLMIERFQAGEEFLPIFVLSLKAGGTGLNLTGANHVFHYDRWWNPAVENQATDRAFRIGQGKNVEVHKFICAGTLEERIDEIIERKTEVAENIVGTGEQWLTEMSNEELKDLFALREEAVGE
ncbi:MAG: DEAD/DEAH box helicase [Methanosarcinaceae archaeon]|nr:DEAD/DEAH box helicase [Methanosarcinaceae archaeon]